MCYADVTILAHNFSLAEGVFRKEFTAPKNAETYSELSCLKHSDDMEYFSNKL
jgi:hypothetical protein